MNIGDKVNIKTFRPGTPDPRKYQYPTILYWGGRSGIILLIEGDDYLLDLGNRKLWVDKNDIY